MDFFQTQDTRTFFDGIHKKMQTEVDAMSDSEITSCDFDEWEGYLIEKYRIEPITIFEDDIHRDLKEVKVKKANPFYQRGYGSYGEPQYFQVDGVCVIFKIYFDGNPALFTLQPSSRILLRFSADNFKEPIEDRCGSFELKLEYTKQELQNKGNEMLKFVDTQFEHEFKNYRQMIQNVNNEVQNFNKSLAKVSRERLQKRKDKATSFAAISEMLQIPLVKNPNAPKSTPVPLKPIIRKPVSKPTAKPSQPEYCISDTDYKYINGIISMCGTTMEKTARTYFRNNEEELRDHLLATLNTHYQSATGETFRKIGKTDILIEFENKAAYIGECKIWHGEKLFQEAIQQVLNYSTWRDTKVSVIIFNKTNKEFQPILKKVAEWISSNTKSNTHNTANVWDCIFHRPDMNIDIALNISVFDLFVDETQFRDQRSFTRH